MKKLRELFAQHTLVMASALIALALLAIFYLQYRSLRTQQTTLSLYRREAMSQYANAVVLQLREVHFAAAKRVLQLSEQALSGQQHGIVADDAAHAKALAAVANIGVHFRQQEFAGARRFFVAVATTQAGVPGGEVFFYNPQRQAMERDPQAPELRAINVACAPYLVYIRARANIADLPAGVDRDFDHRLIVKPLMDGENHIIAVAGMVLDQNWFRTELAPRVIRDLLPSYFPAEQQDVVASLMEDETRSTPVQVHYSTQPATSSAPEISMRCLFVYTQFRIGIRMRSQTSEQWARRNLLLNFLLWGLMTLLLVAGVALVVRTAARERKLYQLKNDFLANVSHELRTPLASMLVFSEMLKRGRVTEADKVREFGANIESIGLKLAQTINQILDYARIESGQKRYQFEPTDLRAVVADALAACAGCLQQNQQSVQVLTPEEALPLVFVDADALTLVLTNLLDNASKYSAADTSITVRLGQVRDGVTLAVSDEGLGIARAEQPKIFEKFYRVSTGLVHDVKGSGLGLAIAKHIVEAHGGQLTVESDLGRGSTFTIHLPGVVASAKAMEKGDVEVCAKS